MPFLGRSKSRKEEFVQTLSMSDEESPIVNNRVAKVMDFE